MTIKQYLTREKVSFSRKDCAKIGAIATALAKEKGIELEKVPEEVMVNDYPIGMKWDLSTICINYFSKKGGYNG